ncbi:MAG: hypothetical protein ACLVAT_02420 [Lachnospiraceae bacterium]
MLGDNRNNSEDSRSCRYR